jgi:hypothetical protein
MRCAVGNVTVGFCPKISISGIDGLFDEHAPARTTI